MILSQCYYKSSELFETKNFVGILEIYWHLLLLRLSPGNCLFPFFLVFSIVSKCLKIAKSWKLWSEKTGKYHSMINVVATYNKITTIRFFLIFFIKRHLFQMEPEMGPTNAIKIFVVNYKCEGFEGVGVVYF